MSCPRPQGESGFEPRTHNSNHYATVPLKNVWIVVNLQWVLRQEGRKLLLAYCQEKSWRSSSDSASEAYWSGPSNKDQGAVDWGWKPRRAGEFLFHVSFVDYICLYLYYYQYEISSHFNRLSEVKTSRLQIILHLLYFKWVVSWCHRLSHPHLISNCLFITLWVGFGQISCRQLILSMGTDSYNLQARKLKQGKSHVDRDQAHSGWGQLRPELYSQGMALGDNFPSNDSFPPQRGRDIPTGLLWEEE